MHASYRDGRRKARGPRLRRLMTRSQEWYGERNAAGSLVILVTMLRRPVATGVQTHVRQVAELLAGQGSRVRVIRPADGVPVIGAALAIAARVPGRVGSESGVRLDRFLHRRACELALRRQLRREPASMVYAQDPRSARAALDARGRRDVPVVMVVHYNESQAEELVQRGLVRDGGRTYRAVVATERHVLPRLDGLVFVSEFMRSNVHRDVPDSRPVPSAIIPNFLGRLESPRTGTASRDCISVGSLNDRKNHVYLLRVLAEARARGHQYTLTLVGDGPLREELQRLTHELELDTQVQFAGALARAEVDELLSSHRVYVHSSEMDNLPFAVIEAMRAGLPVLAGSVGGIPEVLGSDGAGQFWDLADPGSGAEVLIAALEDGDGLRAASAQASQRFATVYSAEVAGRRLVDFLQSARRSPDRATVGESGRNDV